MFSTPWLDHSWSESSPHPCWPHLQVLYYMFTWHSIQSIQLWFLNVCRNSALSQVSLYFSWHNLAHVVDPLRVCEVHRPVPAAWVKLSINPMTKLTIKLCIIINETRDYKGGWSVLFYLYYMILIDYGWKINFYYSWNIYYSWNM